MDTFDNEVILIKEKVLDYDEEGNQLRKTEETVVLCNERSVYSRDFYSASNIGLKAEVVISINAFEYSNETKAIYKDKKLDILRTYKKGELLELTLGEKIGNQV